MRASILDTVPFHCTWRPRSETNPQSRLKDLEEAVATFRSCVSSFVYSFAESIGYPYNQSLNVACIVWTHCSSCTHPPQKKKKSHIRTSPSPCPVSSTTSTQRSAKGAVEATPGFKEPGFKGMSDSHRHAPLPDLEHPYSIQIECTL